MYGGAAGGGKSDALIMDALQYVHVPRYSALILRRTFPDLNLPGAIMHRAKEWLLPQGVHWNDRDKTFTFPSGAQLTFGFLETSRDKYRYQGSEYQYIGFDEGTQFEEADYLYLLSRLRRTGEVDAPLRLRMGTNPGNIGHEWVKARYVPDVDPVDGTLIYPRDENGDVRVFVPARLEDNPSLDAEEYRRNLMELDPVTRAQLLSGDWGARPPGEMFDRQHLGGYIDRDQLPRDIRWCRAWDFAGTKKRPMTKRDPDWTRGVLMGRAIDGRVFVADVESLQGTPSEVERLVIATTERDHAWPGNRTIRLDLEPGSAGLAVAEHYTVVLAGNDFEGVRPTGPKSERARPYAAYWRAGMVWLVRGPWNSAYLAELEGFPNETVHDDQVDASSLAFQTITGLYVPGSAAVSSAQGLARANPYHADRSQRRVLGGRP
jgi:predicted phage terminase large subunit-like protein